MQVLESRSRYSFPAPSLVFVLCLVCWSSAEAAIRVDFGMASGRSDTATPGWQEWQVPNGGKATRKFSGVTLTLSALGEDSELEGQWLKAGLASGATMATDCVAVRGSAAGDEAKLQVEIRGLSPGKHSVVTYHNIVTNENSGALTVSVNDDARSPAFNPTRRVASNEAAESAYLEFEVKDGEPVVLVVSANGSGQNALAVLNGIELDAADPKRRAILPMPADRDWHADGDSGRMKLAWTSPKSASTHHVYFASNPDRQLAFEIIKEATTDSPAYQGEVEASSYEVDTPPSASQIYCCWRVDVVDGEGQVIRGNPWLCRSRQLAFPGAEGYGRFAIGGRGGRVFKVTNLKDSGPGSFRAAVEDAGPRTVIFDVSGRIVLQSRLIVRNPYLTVAGQTAPGKGICLSNYNFGLLGGDDCIIRYVRVRPGDTAGKTLDGMGMAGSDHSIIDHCSISWTQDESFSSRGAKNITFQRNLISEALNVAGHKNYRKGTAHGYAASIGGDIGSFHHNLLAHCSGRNWSLAGGVDQATVHSGRLDLRNNVVYNWRTRTTDGGAKEVNFVNNYYKPGPASKVFHVLMPQHENPFGPQEYYVLGNVMEGRYDASQRYEGVRESPDKPMKEYIVEEPFFDSYVSTTSAETALEDVLADVGCNSPLLDDHDKRVIEEVRTGTAQYQGSKTGFPGLPDSQEDVGGWEDYPEVYRPEGWDSDGDGLPDWWEKKKGLNPSSAAGDFSETHADADQNGYTNLEEYLHQMAAREGR